MSVPRRAVALLIAGVLLVAVAALLLGGRSAGSTGVRTPSQALLEQTRADTLASVAARIYYQEVFGSPNSSAFSVIGVEPGLIHGLESGNLALARRTLNHLVLRHVVHERVVRGSQTLIDVGLKFVIAGQKRQLRAPNGASLGQIEISIQDVIGFVKLFHRLTGADVAVAGRVGHAKTSLPTLARLNPPPAGPFSFAGHRFVVSSFRRTGFGGEPLTISVLLPTA